MQPMWLYIALCKCFDDTFKNAQWRKKKNATNVTMHPLRQAIWEHIWQHTVEKSQTSAVNVNFDPLLQTLWRPISKYTVEKSLNKCNQCDFVSPHEGGNLWRHFKNEHIGEQQIQGDFFNWASPEFAKCWPVSDWFPKNVKVPDWPPLRSENV